MCKARCVNGRHGTDISNIKFPETLSFIIIPLKVLAKFHENRLNPYTL